MQKRLDSVIHNLKSLKERVKTSSSDMVADNEAIEFLLAYAGVRYGLSLKSIHSERRQV